MSLPHILLSLLAEEASTGYDLERTMRAELDPIWRAEVSQIYPELARLRRAGFVVLRVLGPRRGPRRHRHRGTGAGRAFGSGARPRRDPRPDRPARRAAGGGATRGDCPPGAVHYRRDREAGKR